MKCPLCEGTGEAQIRAEAIPATVIGKMLKDARHEKHLSLREVEGITGLSNALISQVENGRIKNPSFHSIVSLCSLYGVKAESLIAQHHDIRRKS